MASGVAIETRVKGCCVTHVSPRNVTRPRAITHIGDCYVGYSNGLTIQTQLESLEPIIMRCHSWSIPLASDISTSFRFWSNELRYTNLALSCTPGASGVVRIRVTYS